MKISLILFLFVLSVFLSAQDLEKMKISKSKKNTLLISSEKKISIDGIELKYQVTAGTLQINKNKSSEANIFFVSYNLLSKSTQKRPLIFAFNGGPGSSSVWLHLGAVGPRKIVLDDEGFPLAPPHKLANNEQTWLKFADLVFIDPVSTGFSRVKNNEHVKQFYSVDKDAQSIGEFIHKYLTRYKRWSSPKFVVGESYGTTRAAYLSEYLLSQGINLDGLILVSPILNFITVRFDEGNDLPFILYLPTYAAAAWYHKKLSFKLQKKSLPEIIADVKNFALKEYSLALLQGNSISAQEKDKTLDQLALFTGISKDYWRENNMRISLQQYMKELLRKENSSIGRFDARFTGIETTNLGEKSSYDPSYTKIFPLFTETLNEYISVELKYNSETKYEILNPYVHPWNWNAQNKYLNVAPHLCNSLTQSPNLKVLVLSGYYDLATPYFATEYTFQHLKLNTELYKNISFAHYESGHMMYLHDKSLKKLTKDVHNFINTCKSLSK